MTQFILLKMNLPLKKHHFNYHFDGMFFLKGFGQSGGRLDKKGL